MKSSDLKGGWVCAGEGGGPLVSWTTSPYVLSGHFQKNETGACGKKTQTKGKE